MSNFINLTPHTIVEVTSGKSFEPSGSVCRMDTMVELEKTVNGVPIYKSVFGKLQGLPEPREGIIYIVSGLCLNSPECKNRADVVAPGNLVRDEHVNPIGCKGFRLP